jgi:uncharacterized membrane protein YagU involved in acid resistance
VDFAMNTDSRLSNSLIVGTVAGLIATGPMTAVMTACKRMLPEEQQYNLPPEQVMEDVADSVHLQRALVPPQKEPIVWVAHYGYGALMGLIYGALTNGRSSRSVGRGMAYGFGVWAANYLVALPTANMKASAHKEPAARNAMMIVSHLAWGVALDFCNSYGRPDPAMSDSPADGRRANATPFQ